MKLKALLLFACAVGMGITSCSKDSSNSTAPAMVAFHLTDAPASYDAVLIDIRAVRVHVSDNGDTSQPSGWIELDGVNAGIYDLLQFQNGVDTLLTRDQVPAGKISQVRLILGPNNSVVIDGTSYSLKTPSAQQSGLKLLVNETLLPGVEYNFTLDFDASRSIVEKGNGDYSLKPVIRVFTVASTGSIDGYIMPANSGAYVVATNGVDSATSYADTISGYYYLGGLQSGTYTLFADAKPQFGDTSVTNISVNTGNITRVDTLQL